VIDLPGLVALCGFSKVADFQQAHCQWKETALHGDLAVRDARWSEAVAVGSLAFVEKIKGKLGVKALHREVEQLDGSYALRESGEVYRTNFDTQNESLRLENTLPWERIAKLRQLTVVRPRAHPPNTYDIP
jgi:REP-associated tyrosine transposase